MEKQKILFVSQEIYPYVPETPMSLLCSKLPQAIKDAYAMVARIRFDNAYYRHDIGARAMQAVTEG